MALAAALRVPPLLLLFPIGRQDEMEVLPDVLMSPWRALEWAENVHHGDLEPSFTEDADTISKFRRHCEFVEMWSQ